MTKSRAYKTFRDTLTRNGYHYTNGMTLQSGHEVEIYKGKKGLVFLLDFGIDGADVFVQASESNNINDTAKALEKAL